MGVNDTNHYPAELNLRVSLKSNKPADSDRQVAQFRHWNAKAIGRVKGTLALWAVAAVFLPDVEPNVGAGLLAKAA